MLAQWEQRYATFCEFDGTREQIGAGITSKSNVADHRKADGELNTLIAIISISVHPRPAVKTFTRHDPCSRHIGSMEHKKLLFGKNVLTFDK